MKTIALVFTLGSLLINGLIVVFNPNRVAELIFASSIICAYFRYFYTGFF